MGGNDLKRKTCRQGSAISMKTFMEIVSQAEDELPEDIVEMMQNVQVTVEERPSDRQLEDMGIKGKGTLLGLYQGIPATRRGLHYMLVLPDKITIYKEPIEHLAGKNPRVIKEVVKHVVVHEIAHHFGISDDELRAMGKY